MLQSSCLCGHVTWTIEEPFTFITHCHCSRCRKAHGAAFATIIAVPAGTFHLHGLEHVAAWESSP